MKARYVHPKFIVIDLDDTSVTCVTTNDHVIDDEDVQIRTTASPSSRDRIRINTTNDIVIGDDRTVF
ncbi:MAG: hypothetical protein MJZ27_10325 [Bacteroidales bacterium]|nr:hypothetical protein [Bacteroidales bacterium]